jgi:MarR family transcriptional regulator, 2-MHQ and catechol-resistance regulon repressor
VALAAFPPFRRFELGLMAGRFSIKLLITMGVERQSVCRGGGLRRPSVLAWLRMWRVVQKVERATAEHLRSHGLNNAQFDVLAHVGAAEGCRQKELGASLLVTKGNVSHLVDQMERRGLISRRQEGRTNRLYLTEGGRRLFEEVVPAHEDLVHQLMSALPKEEQARLHELVRGLDRSL